MILFSFAFCMQSHVANAATDTFCVHTDFPFWGDGQKVLLDVFYFSDSSFKGSLNLRFYKYDTDADSILVLNKQNSKFAFKKGSIKTRIDFSENDSNTYCARKFYEIFKRTGSIAPGSYKVYLTVKRNDTIYKTVFLHNVDSSLNPNSPIRKDINKGLAPKSKSILGLRFEKAENNTASSGAGLAFLHAWSKIDKATKKRGLTSVHHEKNGKSYIDLFYQDWFAGRYEVKNNESLKAQIKHQEDLAHPTNYNTVTNGLDHPSLFSQYKSVNKEKKEKDDVTGDIGVTTNFSNGQQQYSDADNNYYELKGRLELPICNIPVELEGLYTSEDNHREIKSSYFKVHYDIEKMKSDLQQSTNSYNSKFSETQSQAPGIKSVYGSSISNLESQKTKLLNELDGEIGGKNINKGQTRNNNNLQNTITKDLQKQAKDTSGLKQGVTNIADSVKTEKADSNTTATANTASKPSDSTAKRLSADEKEIKDSTFAKQKRIEDKRKQIDALNKRIEKYKMLLSQYENTNHFDSLVGYNKTKDIGNQSDMTYKQMVSRSSNMLPDGQVKGFMAGVTKMDAGMFPKEESKYTMSGQMMKGVDLGYDFGFCESGITIGKTQYIGSDGSIDKYTFYSGKVSFKPAKKQKISLIYYGYSADHKMITDEAFFNNANISAPSFFQPVNIISTKYDGSISKFLTIGTEIATSIKEADKSDVPAISTEDKMAYHFNADVRIPSTPITLQAVYDKVGIGFVNNTLPASLSGTQQYKLAGKTDFFRSFLTIGLEYDHMLQSNFASVGTSTKMGFDIKTNSKKYPNVSFSYKPFTTFQAYNDTFAIQQRPLIGFVWTSKISYQIRRHEKSLRFSASYNKSATTMDTAKTGSSTTQASCMYTDKIISSSISIGTMQLTGTNATIGPVTNPNNTAFLNMTISYALNKIVSLLGGQDIGIASFGLCKYSVNGGIMYRFKKLPFTARVNLKYTDYELYEGTSWTKLYSGSMELMYKIKAKTKKKNDF